jgi:peptidoglycan/LPS O-acetylase OafA/YrhL
VYLYFFPDGAGSRNWRTFLGDTPLFWLPYFAAGMLLSRISGISRFERRWREQKARWFALGDLAFVALLAIYLTEPQHFAWRFILRHGLLLPLHLLVLHDFALGRGCFARLFSLPGMNSLGQLSFSIFIWQNFLFGISFMVLYANPAAGGASLWVSIVGVLVVSALSTHLLEKPLAKRLRRRFAAPEPTTSSPRELLPAS